MRSSPYPPIPPIEMPAARTIIAPGRGELFLRDTGGHGPVVMLLHGWVASADLNWCGAYDALAAAGYRVLAIDHRGHGRGLRPLTPFRLSDCAGDAAAALRLLDASPAIVVGYSMGGAIAQLMARDHPEVVSGLVLSGTAQHWQDPETRRAFRALGLVGVLLSVAPRTTWRAGLRRVGLRDSTETEWVLSEAMRHSVPNLVEAGRELGRFDSRSWLAPLPIPTAVVLTSRDDAVPPRKQHELADAVGAQVFEAPINHLEITTNGAVYNPVLLKALSAVGPVPLNDRCAAPGSSPL
ncbi:MAG: alpha/beta fold hydrolase [Solirubrobacteraceae bacterium]